MGAREIERSEALPRPSPPVPLPPPFAAMRAASPSLVTALALCALLGEADALLGAPFRVRTAAPHLASARAHGLAPQRPLRPHLDRRRTLQPSMSLLPTTLAEFWGAHAFAWAVGAGTILCYALSAASLPLAGAMAALSSVCLALGVMLHRSTEEVGVALSLSGAVSFAGVAALLHAGIRGLVATSSSETCGMLLPFQSSGLMLAILRKLRFWHALLAIGSVGFGLKAANKDRLFAVSHSSSRGVQLPTLTLINLSAGAKMGTALGSQLAEESARRDATGEPALGVANLETTTPLEALKSFAATHRQYRVLVCGGDGTAAWVLGEIEKLQDAYKPMVAILPLGTGNDLARVLGWGKFFRPSSLRARLNALGYSSVALIDRWSITGSLPDGKSSMLLNNYLSVGVDARASLRWARMKAAIPALFSFRLLAKLWYIILGSPELLLHSHRDLPKRTKIICDGQVVMLPPRCQGFMICNTPSYGGGSDLWDLTNGAPLPSRNELQTDASTPASDDGKLEIVAVANVLHLALTLGGFSNAIRVAQGSNISVEVSGNGVPFQVDGEPFSVESKEGLAVLEPFSFRLSRVGSSFMLRAPRGGFAAEDGDTAAGAMELALADGTIDEPTRLALLEKMARA